MNDTTRRGFLGLLAHVPVLGILLVPKQPQKSIDLKRDQINYHAGIYQDGYRLIRWTPVRERLPVGLPANKWTDVLVVIDGKVQVDHYWTFDKGDGHFYSAGITHWSEFPAPPTGAE